MKSFPPERRPPRPALAPDDYKRRRRARRIDRTARAEPQVRAWAEQHGCSLRVLNDGHHWLLEKPGFIAEWWPSSAKLVLNRDYDHDYHAPHWTDAAAVLERHLCCPPPRQTFPNLLQP